MAGRGPQTFKKRQKEQARKERQEEKRAKRIERKLNPQSGEPEDTDNPAGDNLDSDIDTDSEESLLSLLSPRHTTSL